ncbi:hypothetical protein BJ165DRAFT_1478732 [Panaeolus papilionaceus]|nr:hypothetical protein BJ165DRAFT_1478732 [Panaeolus papilionaceus]
MMLLQDLSADLLLSIAYHLESGDHKNLRLVCNSLSDIFAVLVLNCIRIWIKGPVVDSLSHLDLLIWLAEHHPSHKARIQAIRKLSIVSLSPANHARKEDLISSFTDTEDQVVKYLKPALLALQNVHTFTWEVQARDPVITHKIVAETMSSHPHLEKIHVYLTNLTSPVLHHFKNLVSIEYSSYTDQGETSFPRYLSDDFAQAILRSPQLSSFTFTAAEGQEYLFDHILDRCHPSAPNIRLHELVVHRITSLLPIYPLIQNLKVIEITDMDSISAEMFNNFWVAMREKEVQLEKIRVDRVPGALVEYLKWHHGLKSFVLSNDGGYAVNGGISDDDIADEFYFSGLSNHLSTLEELDIHIFYEGKWCFRHELAAVIGQCVSLKRLGLGFGHNDLLLGVRDGGKNTLVWLCLLSSTFFTLRIDFIPIAQPHGHDIQRLSASEHLYCLQPTGRL